MAEVAKIQRQSNIELLRIIAMVFVVLSHVAILSPHYQEMLNMGGYHGLELLMLRLGKVGVHIFFLITGYFSIRATFRAKGLRRVWAQTVFYSLLFLAIGVVTKAHDLTATSYVNAIFPVLFNQYWFVTTFLIIGFIAPALNTIVKSVDRTMLRNYLIGVTVFYYIASLIMGLTGWVNTFDFTYCLFTYSLTYCIGAYIALYRPKFDMRLILMCVVLMLVVMVAWSSAVIKHIIPYDIFPLLIADNGILSIGLGMSIFLIFLQMKPFHSVTINRIAASMFAVYLIHTNKTFINDIYAVLSLERFYYSAWFYVMPFIYALAIFIICVIIDQLRVLVVSQATRRFARR